MRPCKIKCCKVSLLSLLKFSAAQVEKTMSPQDAAAREHMFSLTNPIGGLQSFLRF